MVKCLDQRGPIPDEVGGILIVAPPANASTNLVSSARYSTLFTLILSLEKGVEAK